MEKWEAFGGQLFGAYGKGEMTLFSKAWFVTSMILFDQLKY